MTIWVFVVRAHRGYICTFKRETMIEDSIIIECDHVTCVRCVVARCLKVSYVKKAVNNGARAVRSPNLPDNKYQVIYIYDKDNIFLHGLQTATRKPLDGVTQHRTATATVNVYGTDIPLSGHSALSPAVDWLCCRVSVPGECVHVPSRSNLRVWYKNCLRLHVYWALLVALPNITNTELWLRTSYTTGAAFRRVRATICAVEKQCVLHIVGVCL
jgi:hypothetical protein